MHILEIPSFFPPSGGLFCLDQAKALAMLGHEVRILSNVLLGLTIHKKDYFTLPFGRYEHQMADITVYQSYQRGFPKVVRPNVKRWVRIVQSMFKDYEAKYGRPDILHAHCAKWAGYAAMKISQQYGIPYVISEHLPLMLLEQEFGKAPSSAWQIALLKQGYLNAERVLPVSEELVDDIACYYGKDYRWQYISNTIDTNFFYYRQRQSRGNRPFRFCCIGDYCYRKGYDVLFEAFRTLQGMELHIAGLNTDSDACDKAISQSQLDNVHTYGKINKEKVRDLLYDCDALVLASRSEVQPLVILEALSTGIPVISTECIPHCLRIEGGCTIVPIGNVIALAEAMRKVSLQQDYDGEAVSRKIAEIASPQVIGRKLEQLFSEIVASK